MFFRDVVLERLPASILVCFWLHLGGFGPPSWGQVVASWASNCDVGRLLGDLGRLALILNLSDGDKTCRPGGLPAPFWRPPAMILEGLGGLEAYFLDNFLHNLLLSKFKVSST